MLVCHCRPQLYTAEECLALTLIALRVSIDRKLVMYVDMILLFLIFSRYTCLLIGDSAYMGMVMSTCHCVDALQLGSRGTMALIPYVDTCKHVGVG